MELLAKLNWLDLVIIVVYSAGLLSLGFLFKDQKNAEDFFLGGKSFSWFELGLSTMATQLSAISFISAAAFVGLKANGGLQWLTFEFAVPLAMIFLIVVLVPPLYKAGVFSIYEFLERRFDGTTRTLLSIVFQISRAFATGMMINAVALVLSAVLNIPVWMTVLLAGLITIIYAYQGGMKAVVWGDAIQMIILVLGIIVCTVYAINSLGGWGQLLELAPKERLNVVDFNMGLGEDQTYGFWPMVLGGFFLYISYYGCDQSQAQRSLSGKNLKQVQGALMLNGLVRFPIVLCYCFMGLAVGTFALQNPELMDSIAEISKQTLSAEDLASQKIDYDLLMPVFISEYLPHGIVGLLIIAILSAAMSSLSSAVNSLSAASVEDIILRRRTVDERQKLNYSRYLTVFWGVVCVLLAFLGDEIDSTIIEAINKIGSVFYGPIVATFILAILTKRVHALAANAGLLAGVALNVFIWLSGIPIFWIWWNLIGAVMTLGVAWLVSLLVPRSVPTEKLIEPETETFFTWQSITLTVFFVGMVAFCLVLPAWLG
ncbi:MAG: sodium:solute symporter [Bacteroidota bacterium]